MFRFLSKNKIVEGIYRGPAGTWNFSLLFTTTFEFRVTDCSVFCHLLPRPVPPANQSLFHNLQRHRSPSRRPARGCVSLFLCGHLSIDLSVDLLSSPAAARFVCYAADRLYPSHHNLTSTGRRRWWGRSPNGLATGRPPRAPSPPSPTLSPSFSVRL